MPNSGVYLGKFLTTSDLIRVSDPCYGRDTWCSYVVEDARVGTWNAYAKYRNEGRWGLRVESLTAVFDDMDIIEYTAIDHRWKYIKDARIGVDSGQAGFFDEAVYPGGSDEKFYDTVCNITLSEKHAGIVTPNGNLNSMGVVSSSGFGDGSYPLYVARDDHGRANAVSIVFIEEED